MVVEVDAWLSPAPSKASAAASAPAVPPSTVPCSAAPPGGAADAAAVEAAVVAAGADVEPATRASRLAKSGRDAERTAASHVPYCPPSATAAAAAATCFCLTLLSCLLVSRLASIALLVSLVVVEPASGAEAAGLMEGKGCLLVSRLAVASAEEEEEAEEVD